MGRSREVRDGGVHRIERKMEKGALRKKQYRFIEWCSHTYALNE